jgi:prepilin-type processing-associated H-X9-DG protein
MYLLPYLEQGNIYALWNPNAASGDYLISQNNNYSQNVGTMTLASPNAVASGNAALAANRIEIFLCPADIGPETIAPSGSYSPDLGKGVVAYHTNYEFVTRDKDAIIFNFWSHSQSLQQTDYPYAFGENSTTRITDITDGTSNTLAMGEQTRNTENGTTSSWAYRGWVQIGIDPVGMVNTTTPAQGLNVWSVSFANGGLPIIGTRASWYNAASMHKGGVNFVFADGSVHFISETIDVTSLTRLCQMGDGHEVSAPY